MIAEGGVLLRVEDFQQGRRGVAAEIRADLVDLVHHEDRVAGPGLLDALDDAAGQGAHVGPAVAPDLGFVANAAERDPDELPAQRPRDRFPQRRFADARWADKAEDRALHLLLHFADGEIFENPLLHLFQIVVILVEHLGGGLDVEGVLGLLAPGQFHQPFEVGADRRRFCGVRMHLLKPLELFVGLFEDLLGHLGVFDVLAELGHFFGPLVQFAQFFLDGLQLLTEEVIALGLVHLALGFGLDLLLHREDFDFRAQEIAGAAEPGDRIINLQHLLGGVHLEPQVRDGHVGEPAGVLEGLDHDHHVRHQDFAEADEAFELLLHGPYQGLPFEGRARQFGLGDLREADFQVGLGLDEFLDAGLGQPLHEDFDPVVGQLEHAHHHAHRADGVDVLRHGVFDVQGALGGQHDNPVARKRRLDGLDRHLPADEKRENHVGKDDDVANRQERKTIRDVHL